MAGGFLLPRPFQPAISSCPGLPIGGTYWGSGWVVCAGVVLPGEIRAAAVGGGCRFEALAIPLSLEQFGGRRQFASELGKSDLAASLLGLGLG